jgi:CHASE2 domain-containing sensor protein
VTSTVLIGSQEHLAELRARTELQDATAFSDEETLRALDTITRQRPKVIALERTFATGTRGMALIERIKADPQLVACEIRIVAHDSGYVRTTVHPSTDTTVAVTGVMQPAPSFDLSGTRRAPRIRIVDGVEVLLDGFPARLVDLSTLGAQVASPTVLRPNQRLRLTIPWTQGTIRVSAVVAWAVFEMPPTGARYRAGMEFVQADADMLQRFCDAHAAD